MRVREILTSGMGARPHGLVVAGLVAVPHQVVRVATAAVVLQLFASHPWQPFSPAAADPGATPGPVACDLIPDTDPWCADLPPWVCSSEGALGTAVRGACPSSCRSCSRDPGETAPDRVLQNGGTVTYRTGFVFPDPKLDSHSKWKQDGWDLWLERSGALTTGIPVGAGRVLINHTTISVNSSKPDCDVYYNAARELIDVHKIHAAVILHHFCMTNLSATYHEAGVVHFVQSGMPIVKDGRPYINKHSWHVFLDSNDYALLFLKKLKFAGASKVAVVWSKAHPFSYGSAESVISSLLPRLEMELVYSKGWEPEQAGSYLTAAEDPTVYEEAYDTAVWDKMLLEIAAAGADVLLCHSLGEGASILLRMKELGISFRGVYMTVSPTRHHWSQLMGRDGDLVASPAQWDPALSSPCFLFGSTQEYAAAYAERFGEIPNYFAAASTATGLFLQLAMQMYDSISSDLVIAGLQTMSNDTMFGRVKFSYAQRNIGRSPVMLQRQNSELRLTLPEELADSQLASFVDWSCRELLYDADPDTCTDAELSFSAQCAVDYPELVTAACESRLEAEAVQRRTRALLSWVLPLTMLLAVLLLLVLILTVRRWRANLMRSVPEIPWDELHFANGTESDTSVIPSSLDEKSPILFANWRGTKVAIRPAAQSWGRPADETPSRAWHKRFKRVIRPSYIGSGWRDLHTSRTPTSPEGSRDSSTSPACEVSVVAAGASEPARLSIGAMPTVDTAIAVEDPAVLPEGRSGCTPTGFLSACCYKFMHMGQDRAVILTGNAQAATHLRHPNLVSLLGNTYSKASGKKFVVMELMAFGSLRDIIQDDVMGVNDLTTIVQILSDVVAGIQFLHDAKPHIVHGDIRAKNVLLDEKLTAKVRTDTKPATLVQGRNEIGRLDSNGSTSMIAGAMSRACTAWMAPELLRGEPPSCQSDMYALGMTMWEAFSRSTPYQDMATRDPMALPPGIVHQIIAEDLRPVLPLDVPPQIQSIIKRSWSQDPAARPGLREVARTLQRMRGSVRSFEHHELKQSRNLLHQILPPHVASALEAGRKVEPEFFNAVTIFFSDIVGYTDISAEMPPQKVMLMLDRLYQEFDNLTRKHGLFKVETIGDAYMCVGGLEPQADHAARIARFSLEAVRAANSVLIDIEQPELGFVNIRAGFHTGPVVASVVGDLNPRYCLFGDSVNTAARMESNSKPNKINISDTAREALGKQAPGDFRYQSRGKLSIKGKGKMECSFLVEEMSSLVRSGKLPSLPPSPSFTDKLPGSLGTASARDAMPMALELE